MACKGLSKSPKTRVFSASQHLRTLFAHDQEALFLIRSAGSDHDPWDNTLESNVIRSDL